MTAHRLLALTAATGALACAGPALAHPGPNGQSGSETTIVYGSDPVVQPIPELSDPPPPREDLEHETHTVVHEGPEHAHRAPPPPRDHAGPHAWSAPHVGMHAPPHGMVPYPYPAPYPATHYPEPPRFDRDEWLNDCRERIRGVDREERGGVIGGLLGAAAGGVIGNRAWGSERLAGTLLGAGVGGLAGLAIGSAIGAAGDRTREDECAWHLDRYMAARHPGPGYGYGYGYGYPAVAYVPVLVQIPQRAVVREYVTEEWVDVPVRTRNVTETKIIRQPAPPAGKRTKLIKAK